MADLECINKHSLTKRNIEQLALVSLGLNNTETAEKMFVSVHTIKKSLEVIYEKLNASGRANAVSRGLEYGILNNALLKEIKQKYGL